jgi:hypothetical protein
MVVNVPQYLFKWLYVRDTAIQQTGLAMTAQEHEAERLPPGDQQVTNSTMEHHNMLQ